MIIKSYDYSLKATRNYSASLTKSSGLKLMDKNHKIADPTLKTIFDLDDRKSGRTKGTDRLGEGIIINRTDLMEMHQKLLQNLFRNVFGEESEIYQRYFGRGESYSLQYGYSMSYMESLSYVETEESSFEGQARIETENGRSFDISYTLNMSRTFTAYMENNKAVKGNFLDPLVINLDSNPANVSDMHFYFDLDCDGSKEEISTLAEGSGFLALDKNNDGIINDGAELFGAISGDGFADLAEFDHDGNGFIDEADEIFDRLKIWVAAGTDTPKLLSLKEAGVGAICLGNVDTKFSLKNADNKTNALIRKTGFFLYENGGAGSIQQVDLLKHGTKV